MGRANTNFQQKLKLIPARSHPMCWGSLGARLLQWQRDINAELDALGCDAAKRKRLVLGGSAAAWHS